MARASRLRLLALFFASLAAAALRAEAPVRTPPAIYASAIAPLLTPLDEVLAGRAAFPDSHEHGLVLLSERVHYRAADGTLFRVVHDVLLARDDSASDQIGNRIYSYNRENESLFLVDAATLRPDGSRVELDERAAFIQTPQRAADYNLYTSDQELNLIFPEVVAGAVTESIVLIREDKPFFPGEFSAVKSFGSGWPTFRTRVVVDFPTADMARIHEVRSSALVPTALNSSPATGRKRRVWQVDNLRETDWEESAPAPEFKYPTLWLTTLSSWDAVATWFHGLVADRTELGPDLAAQLATWTAGLTDRRALIDRLCSTVANDVRYTGLEFGLAGYQPYACSTVWAQRYGDCKDKANLLRALLAAKGIRAHLVLLDSGGIGRVEKRSPSWTQFNHAIVAVEDPANPSGYLFCDPTIKFLPAGSLGLGDYARDVLVIRDDHAQWVRTPDPLENEIHIDADLHLDAAAGLSGWFTLSATASDAAYYADSYNNTDPAGRLRSLQNTAENFFPGVEVIDVDYQPPSGAIHDFKIRGFLLRKPAAAGPVSLAFPYPGSWLPDVDTHGTRRFPYGTIRRTESVDVRITLPAGWSADSLPSAFTADSSSAAFAASWQFTSGQLRARLAWHPAAAEFSPADYAVFQRSVRSLRTWLDTPARLAASPSPATPAVAAAAAKPAADLGDDFPILATGEGQLRLLDEKFPADGHDPRRHAALEKILQWFPDDHDTVFEAGIWLALLDHADDDNAFADGTATLLARHAGHLTAANHSWGRYLHARAVWWARHDPAAIAELRELAADTSLDLYRRSWSAYYAGLFLNENDPAAALAFLRGHDAYAGDARPSIVKLEARLLARQAEPAAIAAWVDHLAADAPDAAATLLTDAVAALAANDFDPPVPGDALGDTADTLRAVFAHHPNLTSIDLTALDATASVARARHGLATILQARLDQHPIDWIHPARDPAFADIPALEKALDAANDAHQARVVVDATFQLIRFHDPDYDTAVKYLYWAAWWLEHDQLEPDLLTFLSDTALTLPVDGDSNLMEICFHQAKALEARKNRDAARAVFARIIAKSDVHPFQHVIASAGCARLDYRAGRVDDALHDLDEILADHATARQGSDFLLVAAFIALDSGHPDLALKAVQGMATHKAEDNDSCTHAACVKLLAPLAAHPEELLAFWRRQESWFPAWQKLLATNLVVAPPPGDLRLPEDLLAPGRAATAALAARDPRAFLLALDQLVGLARWIPMFASDVCSQSVQAGSLSTDLLRQLNVFDLALVTDFPQLDPAATRSMLVWQAAALCDLGRRAESATVARTGIAAIGPDTTESLSLGRIWLIAAAGQPDEVDAIAFVETALQSGRALVERPRTVAMLSDTYQRRGDAAAQRVLLTRELAHPDLVADTARHDTLAARLRSLDSPAATDLAVGIQAWIDDRHLEWLRLMPPADLTALHADAPSLDAIYKHDSRLTLGETLRANLLLALDPARSVTQRTDAFATVASEVALLETDAADALADLESALAHTSLPADARSHLIEGSASTLLSHGHAAEARRLLDNPAVPDRDRFNTYYASAFDLAAALAKFSPDSAATSFRAALAKPLNLADVTLLGVLLRRLALTGDDALASSLVADADQLQLLAYVGRTPADLRLEWSRLIRQLVRERPLTDALRDQLIALAPPDHGDALAFQSLLFGFNLRHLHHRTATAALAVALRDHLCGEFPAPFLLGSLPTPNRLFDNHHGIGPELLHRVLTADLDDSARSKWLEAVIPLCDFDTPAALARFRSESDTFLRSALGSGQHASASRLRLALAHAELRTSTEDRPTALFAPAADLPPDRIQILQFRFAVSRGQPAAADFLNSLPPDRLTPTFVAPYTLAAARAADATSLEQKLLVSGIREAFEKDLPDLWREPGTFRMIPAAQTAIALDQPDLLPDTLFARAIALSGDLFGKTEIQALQARLHKNWADEFAAADRAIQLQPELYSLYFLRAEAAVNLDRPADARRDLEIFLRYGLDSFHAPEARRLLARLP